MFGYARVSTVSQEDNTSLAVQAERIRSFTAARGWPEPQVIEDIASGANLVRPGLASLRETLRPGDAIVVFKLDRLSRSVVDLEPLLIAWEAKGISLHSVSGNRCTEWWSGVGGLGAGCEAWRMFESGRDGLVRGGVAA